MKNYKDNDYALNRYSDGIVYRFADKTVTVTLADFLSENPGKTEEDFRALKAPRPGVTPCIREAWSNRMRTLIILFFHLFLPWFNGRITAPKAAIGFGRSVVPLGQYTKEGA